MRFLDARKSLSVRGQKCYMGATQQGNPTPRHFAEGPSPMKATPRFPHMAPSERIVIIAQPPTESGRAVTRGFEVSSPDQPVNLMSGQYHVPQQQANQLGHSKAQGRRRMHQPDPDTHRGGQRAQQFLEGKCLRSGGVGH